MFIRPETFRVSEGGNKLIAFPGIEVSEEYRLCCWHEYWHPLEGKEKGCVKIQSA
jgi:hypothetical protein